MGNNKITKQNLMDQTLCYFVILMDQKYQNNKFCYFVILLFCYFVILMDQNNKFCYFDGSKFVILMDHILLGGGSTDTPPWRRRQCRGPNTTATARHTRERRAISIQEGGGRQCAGCEKE